MTCIIKPLRDKRIISTPLYCRLGRIRGGNVHDETRSRWASWYARDACSKFLFLSCCDILCWLKLLFSYYRLCKFSIRVLVMRFPTLFLSLNLKSFIAVPYGRTWWTHVYGTWRHATCNEWWVFQMLLQFTPKPRNGTLQDKSRPLLMTDILAESLIETASQTLVFWLVGRMDLVHQSLALHYCKPVCPYQLFMRSIGNP